MNSLFGKGMRVLSTRPAQFYSSLRGYLLFRCTRLCWRLFHSSDGPVRLGKNVRLQKSSSLSAERPAARITVGNHSIIYENARIGAYGEGKIEIGERSIVGDVRIFARERVSIGKRAVFSWNVFIQDFQPHPVSPELRALQLEDMTSRFLPAFDGVKAVGQAIDWKFPTEPVELGDDIWFGANTTILPGVKIGSGSIVAAGAVVTRGDYPPRSILAGNPARVVKTVGTDGD